MCAVQVLKSCSRFHEPREERVWRIMSGTFTLPILLVQLGNNLPLIMSVETDELANIRASCVFPGHPMFTFINNPRKSTSACIRTE